MDDFFTFDLIKEQYSSKVLHWLGSDSHSFWLQNQQKNYSDTEIEYKFNSDGFRCDEFSTNNQYKKRVLFIGCSHTLGTGLAFENVWAYKFYSQMVKDNLCDCPYWNLAYGGISLDFVSRILYKYIPILKPYAIICCLPDVSRREIKPNVHLGAWTYKESKYHVLLDDEYISYQLVKNLVLIDSICKLNHCKFFAANSFNQKHGSYNFAFNTNLLTNIDLNMDVLFTILDRARDSMHWGPKSHKNYANNFYISCKDKLLNHVQFYTSASQL